MAKEFIYQLDQVAHFRMTRKDFGGFSNFAPYPITIQTKLFGKITAATSEHVYQAAKFSSDTEICRKVLLAENPMDSKKIAYANLDKTRLSERSWMENRVNMMRWVVKQKMLQHDQAIMDMFRQTENRLIVENSNRDAFWGAKPIGDGRLRGVNMLGRLWMELRDQAALDGRIDGVAFD